MEFKRWTGFAVVGFAASPIALGLGIILLVATFDDDKGGSGSELTAGSLKIGKGGVPAKYANLVQKAADDCDQGLPAAVLAAQIQQESGWNPRAESKDEKGNPIAQGISQFIPGTWASSGIDGNGDGRKDVWDPEDAIPSQGQMMCHLLETAKKHPAYSNSPIELALAGYNSGWGWVDHYKGVPPKKFADGQTYNYVEIIMANVAKLTAYDDSEPVTSGDWSLPVKASLGTPYHQSGSMWSSGYHTGIDFAVQVGTTLHAIGPGKVVERTGPSGPYGNEIVIKHPDGMYSQYAHMSQVKVAIGQTITGGQVIGLSGATGNVSGPHLHLEIRTGPKYGSDISPLPYLRKKGLKI
ncbi:Glycyl-glycine endopeptidase ALE-1 precursor [Streptomyces sp. ADI92-24]|uniref:peptidoglycan DD-metalloendopeptidase family protein n=1 Tax=Streptomyces sp. ADI92-24 TaxID=1522756 RepID=UPI000F5564B2|nr:peptidoglycan DD-metalloendopeptidase family protein [Streptomyces sp. ADI92-24]RPK32402.1 Glycyl-glycine endopeptidase ALE-1 precursor [Streptomyces sp. ADI92-24]